MVNEVKEQNANEKLENEGIQFYNLAPNEVEAENVYLKALDYAMQDENIHNIAITGKNGAGKSSVIRTYENLHPEHKYVNISLTDFNNNGQEKNQIERSILEQFFYTVNSSKIPHSKFRRIKKIQKKSTIKGIAKIFLLVILLAISIFLFVNPIEENLPRIIDKYFSDINQAIITIGSAILAVSIVVYIVYKLYEKIFATTEMSGLKLKRENIELNKEVDTGSVFDKYLDEIIYFFEVTKYDVVVIEDIDRFENCSEIFTKLREMNKLINDCETINKQVKFIYASRDDVFVEKERTKFFDFIIPIIPVINSSNSKEILIDKLHENKLENALELEYIKDIAWYIDDMRTLNNIINEFNIYRQTIKLHNLVQEKLFSIILLKNLYPKEFAELQDDKGIIFNIFNKKESKIRRIKEKIEQKDIKINEEKLEAIEESSIATLIDEFGVETVLNEEERQNELITYLIVNQYIDEDYNEYINYFYEGTLSKEDKEFIMAVKIKKEMPYNYNLVNIAEVIENLPIKNFNKKYILNFDLIDYLLEHKKEYTSERNKIFSQMKDNNDEIIGFCTSYISRGKNVKVFISEMCKYWKDMWNYLHFNGNEEIKRIYLYNITKYADRKEIEKINELGLLKEGISEEADFIGMFKNEEEIEAAKKIISLLNIKFENLDGSDLESPLGEYILENNCYEINQDTIKTILKNKYKVTDKNIKNRNYSSIIQTNNNAIIAYIQENIKEYVSNIFLNEDALIEDAEEDIVNLLNNKKLEISAKEEIINKLETATITHIDEMNKDLWETLIVNDKVYPSWNNVIEYYYEKEELNEELIEYINANVKTLSKSKIDEADNFAEDVQQEFCDDVIREERISEEIMKSLTSFNIDEEILKTNLSNQRVEQMIEGEMLPMESSTYKIVRENYKVLLPKYVAMEPSFFVREKENLEYDKNDIKGILANTKLSKEEKQNIFISFNDKIACDNANDANMYYNIVGSNDRNKLVSTKLLKKMIKYLDEEKALKLIINKSNELDEKNTTECLKLLGEPYNGIPTKAIPKIKKTKVTEDLMKMLKKKNLSYISSISENKGYYTVYKTRK